MALPFSRSTLFITLTVFVLCLSLSHLPFMSNAQDGTATFYTPPYTPSACYGYEDEGTMIAAASDEIWNNGAACGKMYQVKIVDYCPSAGCRSTIDLSQEVFASIADPDSGVINISYQQV
ncbi:Barwin-related endoglucanase [Corchorus olitorius]|uniref:Barwin-related endoglucanase n=1 Tax=Corchorus olitorius TaxID=93759 RepID=A0A1R3J3C2_9ROSI|nr:Barwin-related endoglucanase [Corchorus olitorius]